MAGEDLAWLNWRTCMKGGGTQMAGIYFSGGVPRFEMNSTDGERRLRDALGQLLQVNHLAVLMGTGSSFHLGAPKIRTVTMQTLGDFCKVAGAELTKEQALLLEGLVGQGADLESLLGQLNSMLSYAEAFNLTEVPLNEKKVDPQLVKETFGAVNVGLASACDLPLGDLDEVHATNPWHSHREFFRRLLGSRRPDAARVRIFTTNYDTVIERALDASGIQYLDGFVGGVRRSFNLRSYYNDVFTSHDTGGRALLRVRDLVLLYKIHGSLTWRAEPPASGLGTSTIVQAPGAPEPGQLAVIYPTPAKDADVLGHPYADLLREFGAAISTPECALLVLGYGFADDHINRFVYQALAFNSTLQVLVADPFGVIPSGSTVRDGDIERTDSPIGRLSRVSDPRISIVTGEVAKFTNLVKAFPDVGEQTLEQKHSLDTELLSALGPLGPPPFEDGSAA
jgi:hypothetical protein